jgi:PadR family transcriptional regulator PadR
LNLDNWRTQLRKGLLEVVVLNLLQRGQCHGYEMVKTLKKDQSLKIREGNIYPILARLQTDGLVSSYTEASRDGPPRKSYKLTEWGEQAVSEMNAHWDRIVESVDRIRRGTQR